VIPPLAAAAPFILLKEGGVVRLGETPIAYPAYALIGTTIWQAFVDALNAPLKTFTAAKSMLVRINLPREGILLSGLLRTGSGVLVRLTLLAATMAVFGIVPAPTAWLFFIGIVALILAGFVLGLALTPLGLLYSDVQNSLPILTTFLMLLTPVVYPVPQTGVVATIAHYNPLTPLISATRDWLLIGSTPHVAAFVVITVAALVFLLVGWIVFRVAMPHIIARIGN
jgi:lipopolysaccharide transport system permease protein